MTAPAPLPEVRGLVKDYPGVRALDGVDLTVTAGQVHCVVGQNGAGKSALIKCVTGLVVPTGGTISVEGRPLPPGDPGAALARGVAAVYQELDLVDDLTMVDNLFLWHELRRGVGARCSSSDARRCAARRSSPTGSRRSPPSATRSACCATGTPRPPACRRRRRGPS